MKNLKRASLSITLILLGVMGLYAQPGNCYPGMPGSTFDPLRTCSSEYISSEFVFVGRMLSRESGLTKLASNPAGVIKVTVSVEQNLKGELPGTTDLFLDYLCGALIKNGEKRIFTANRVMSAGFGGVVSSKWSTSLEDIPDSRFAELLKAIRSVSKGETQPRVIGKIVEYDLSPDSLAGFSGEDLNTILGFDPKYSHPLKGIEIIADPVDEEFRSLNRHSYKTRSNMNGDYKFADLPPGLYEIYIRIPQGMSVRTYIFDSRLGFRSTDEEKKTYVRVRAAGCSEDVRFNVRGNRLHNRKSPS